METEEQRESLNLAVTVLTRSQILKVQHVKEKLRKCTQPIKDT